MEPNGLARLRSGLGRRTVQPPHPHLFPEPAQARDLGGQSIPAGLDGDVVTVQSGLRQHVLRAQLRLRLNGQVRSWRVDESLAGATAHKRERRGEG